MPTLSSCIRKAGKALSANDATIIQEIQQEYLADGMRSGEATQKAIADYLETLADDRGDAITQLGDQGGDISPYTGGTRTSLVEQERGDNLLQLRNQAQRETDARETTAADLRHRETTRLQAPKVRYGFNDDEIDQVNNDPSAPESVSLKMAQTVEEMSRAPTDRSIFRKLREAHVSDMAGVAKIQTLLDMSPTRNLVDYAPESMKETGRRINYLNKLMVGRESKLTANVRKLLDPWIKLHSLKREVSGIVSGLMQRSTLARVDPSEAYKPRLDIDKTKKRIRKLEDALLTGAKGPGKLRKQLSSRKAQVLAEEIRRTNHAQLKNIFATLPEEAKKVFTDVRDMFRNQYNDLEKTLIERIDNLEADGKTRQALRAMIEKTFESGRIDPYFPLARYGSYWAVAKGADDEILAYSQFKKKSDRNDWISNWRSTGADVTGGRDSKAGKEGQGAKVAAVDPKFTMGIVSKLKGMQTAQSQEVNNLIDDIWQTYLQSLPEMSARKQFIHRKNVMGFTGDGLRAVADASLRNARRIAKVEYQYQIENELRTLRKEAGEVSMDDWAMPVHDEIRQRHNWHMDHQGAVWASVLTSLGFHNFLGVLRPSAAIVNLTQTILVAFPVLSAFALNKQGSAFVELSRASKDVASLSQWAKDPFADPDSNKRFNEEESQAMHDFSDKFALLDKTRTHDLLGLQEAGAERMTSKWHKAMEVSGWLFHNTEVFNRKVTALAAYRLGKMQGMSHDAAVYKAVQLTEDSHFDYASQNRPRFMQSDAARVAFLFRNYTVNMYYYLGRNFHDKLKSSGGTPQQRKEAARRFWGTMGVTSAMAGAAGWPFVWTLMTAADLIVEAFDDDEDEELREIMDPKTRMRIWIQEAFGETWGDEAAAILMDGLIDGIPYAIRENTDFDMPNPTLSTRLTLANVAFQDAPADAPPLSTNWWSHYTGEVLGPSIGLLQDYGQGIYDILQGDERAYERMLPSTPTDIMKTYRYAMEGVKSGSGATLLDDTEIKASDYAMQLIGFTPYSLTRQYEENRSRRYVDKALELRRESLSNTYRNALRYEDDLVAPKEEIRKHNRNYPAYRIDIGILHRNLGRTDRNSIDGMRVSRRRQRLLREIETTDP